MSGAYTTTPIQEATMSTTTVLILAAVYLAVGVAFAVAMWRKVDDSAVRRRNARFVLPAVALGWPGAAVIGVLCQFAGGRRVVGKMFDVDPAEIFPGHRPNGGVA